MVEIPDGEVREEIVVWEYLRWDGKYENWNEQPILKTPDFNNDKENRMRFDMLVGNSGYPGDVGQVARLRYPFHPELPRYQWTRKVAKAKLFEKAFLNYGCDGRFLSLDEVANEFSKEKRLPLPFNDDNTSVVNKNLHRLKHKEEIDTFNAILFCRPTRGLPKDSYRIVEGTKRAIAYRVAQLEAIELPEIYGYFGDYVKG